MEKKNNYPEITIEDIRKWKAELNKNNIPSRNTSYTLPQGHIGNGVYRIADGFLTNEAGWDMYIKALKERLNDY